MVSTYKAASDIEVLTSNFPIPGFGFVPVNAFVLKGPEPILVDTGTVVESADFLSALRSVIDPADLRWIWLTHTDFDHTGSLQQLPMDRIHLVNPGQKITWAGARWPPSSLRCSTTLRRPASTTRRRACSSAPTVSERSSLPFEYCDDLTPVEAETAHYAHHRAQQQPKLSNH
jgi:hypothetical protein